eukprot:CAMPEP_0168263760 /NCGR_PEP_ID=MMETSP0141_2-20121125/10658_1 /TAXON_ID=44445 /ORGANISM="Pseudo-nitzschia australis, Strain 10249 10 AB" /LENGTH=179 /DNA_ID=CAMNT_0008202745 /DNA_START=51 /DNA_END=587 /DNA_ORIENTATION=+
MLYNVVLCCVIHLTTAYSDGDGGASQLSSGPSDAGSGPIVEQLLALQDPSGMPLVESAAQFLQLAPVRPLLSVQPVELGFRQGSLAAVVEGEPRFHVLQAGPEDAVVLVPAGQDLLVRRRDVAGHLVAAVAAGVVRRCCQGKTNTNKSNGNGIEQQRSKNERCRHQEEDARGRCRTGAW